MPRPVKRAADVCDLLRLARQNERMSSVSVAAAISGASAASAQMALAAKMMRMNADAEASVAKLIDAGQQNLQQLADAAAGLGQNLDISVRGVSVVHAKAGTHTPCRLVRARRMGPGPRASARARDDSDRPICRAVQPFPSAALIIFTASSLAHSAGPAMVPISQPLRSTSRVVGMPKARPTAFRSWKLLALGSA